MQGLSGKELLLGGDLGPPLYSLSDNYLDKHLLDSFRNCEIEMPISKRHREVLMHVSTYHNPVITEDAKYMSPLPGSQRSDISRFSTYQRGTVHGGYVEVDAQN